MHKKYDPRTVKSPPMTTLAHIAPTLKVLTVEDLKALAKKTA